MPEKIHSLCGNEEYKQVIEEETWYYYRGINIDWYYKFAIAMDLENVGISVTGGAVDVSISEKYAMTFSITM